MYEYQIGEILKQKCIEWGAEFYPEFEGWDAVVKYSNLLFGIQFKLELDLHSIVQCINKTGVDFKCVVFKNYPTDPIKGSDLLAVMEELKILKFQYKPELDHFSYSVYRYRPYWLLDYKHRPKVRLYPEGNYDIKAGSKAPLRVTQWAINLCKLELMNVDTYYGFEIRSYLGNIPKKYFKWDKTGYIMIRKPSLDYPHIYKGLK